MAGAEHPEGVDAVRCVHYFDADGGEVLRVEGGKIVAGSPTALINRLLFGTEEEFPLLFLRYYRTILTRSELLTIVLHSFTSLPTDRCSTEQPENPADVQIRYDLACRA